MAEKSDKDCTTCKWFKSFRQIYGGDLMEPDEYGWCYYGGVNHHNRSPDLKPEDSDVCIGYDYVCSRHETENSEYGKQ